MRPGAESSGGSFGQRKPMRNADMKQQAEFDQTIQRIENTSSKLQDIADAKRRYEDIHSRMIAIDHPETGRFGRLRRLLVERVQNAKNPDAQQRYQQCLNSLNAEYGALVTRIQGLRGTSKIDGGGPWLREMDTLVQDAERMLLNTEVAVQVVEDETANPVTPEVVNQAPVDLSPSPSTATPHPEAPKVERSPTPEEKMKQDFSEMQSTVESLPSAITIEQWQKVREPEKVIKMNAVDGMYVDKAVFNNANRVISSFLYTYDHGGEMANAYLEKFVFRVKDLVGNVIKLRFVWDPGNKDTENPNGKLSPRVIESPSGRRSTQSLPRRENMLEPSMNLKADLPGKKPDNVNPNVAPPTPVEKQDKESKAEFVTVDAHSEEIGSAQSENARQHTEIAARTAESGMTILNPGSQNEVPVPTDTLASYAPVQSENTQQRTEIENPLTVKTTEAINVFDALLKNGNLVSLREAADTLMNASKDEVLAMQKMSQEQKSSQDAVIRMTALNALADELKLALGDDAKLARYIIDSRKEAGIEPLLSSEDAKRVSAAAIEASEKKVADRIRAEKSMITAAKVGRKSTGLFGMFHRTLTLSDPYAVEINTSKKAIASMQYAQRFLDDAKNEPDMEKRAELINSARRVLSMHEVDALCAEKTGDVIHKMNVDRDLDHYELEQKNIDVSRDVAIDAIVTVGTLGGGAAANIGRKGAQMAVKEVVKRTIIQAAKEGAKEGMIAGGILGGSTSTVKNIDDVTEGKKTVIQAVGSVATDTAKGAATGAVLGAGLGAGSEGLSRLRKPSVQPRTSGTPVPEAPPVDAPAPRPSLTTVESSTPQPQATPTPEALQPTPKPQVKPAEQPQATQQSQPQEQPQPQQQKPSTKRESPKTSAAEETPTQRSDAKDRAAMGGKEIPKPAAPGEKQNYSAYSNAKDKAAIRGKEIPKPAAPGEKQNSGPNSDAKDRAAMGGKEIPEPPPAPKAREKQTSSMKDRAAMGGKEIPKPAAPGEKQNYSAYSNAKDKAAMGGKEIPTPPPVEIVTPANATRLSKLSDETAKKLAQFDRSSPNSGDMKFLQKMKSEIEDTFRNTLRLDPNDPNILGKLKRNFHPDKFVSSGNEKAATEISQRAEALLRQLRSIIDKMKRVKPMAA